MAVCHAVRRDPNSGGELQQLSASQREAVEGVAETADVRLAITFPGTVIDHNGELAGRTVTWSPSGTEPVQIQARAEDSAPDSFAEPAIAAVLILGAVAVLALRGRLRSQDRPSDPPSSEVAEA